MIKKKAKKSRKIQKLEVLLSRTPHNLPQRDLLNDILNKELAGYEGELKLEYYLRFLTQDDFLVLNNIRLKDDNGYFQMDAILLTKYFILIMDSKYWTGYITIDSCFKQFIQLNKGRRNVYSDPVLQISLQEKRFKAWLKKMKYPAISIKSLVVFTNRNVVLETPPANYPFLNRLLKAPEILSKIDSLLFTYEMEIYTSKDLNKLSKLLCKYNVPEDPDYLNQFQIPNKSIIKGVKCNNCESFSMKRFNGIWVCPKCNHKSSDAHLEAIRDFSLLYGREITNGQLREFLHLPSRSVAQKILASMRLPSTGQRKYTIYYLPIEK
ncbi:NERD domain-containing protein [Evansella tamaricis]|uniref:NERD domain-containing protein n=1 Tax=Evansella tamaricis TaxID=2069301 RepID=A0ABS6JAV5_9BACI|nr:NERD domain-containing protein [Evansella tamaricis]MBU9710809.1 NERD domain-containing protein [Evansella tamaricis]